MMQVPEDIFTATGAPKRKKRFNMMNVNMHYGRNHDVFSGFSHSQDYKMDPSRLPEQEATSLSPKK